MTTPSKAQIEAAAQSLYGPNWRDFPDCEEAARDALTAAAQVGEPDRLKAVEAAYVHASDEIERLNAARLADARRMVVMSDEYEALEEATIERCAQVAEQYWMPGSVNQYPHEIAAAIRKLKNDAA